MITLLKKLSPVLLLMLMVVAACKKDSYNFKDLAPTVKSFYTVVGADFEMGDEVQFKNESLNATTYTWDFGDGTTSTDANPKKVYPDAGVYSVVLKAVGAGGTGTFSKDVTIIDPNAPAPGKETIYFMEYGVDLIKKIAVAPGSLPIQVADISGKTGLGIAYDAVDDQLYYTNEDAGSIVRMDIDGSNATTIATGADAPYGIAVNSVAKKVYWSDGENISTVNFDGTNETTNFITVTGADFTGVAYSAKSNKIYFYDFNKENLYIADADGTNAQILIPEIFGYAIFVDDVNSKIYYDDRDRKAIMKANLDGTNIEEVVQLGSSLIRVAGIGIDYTAGKLYWTDRANNVIRRANLNGSSPENFLTGARSPRYFFIR